VRLWVPVLAQVAVGQAVLEQVVLEQAVLVWVVLVVVQQVEKGVVYNLRPL